MKLLKTIKLTVILLFAVIQTLLAQEIFDAIKNNDLAKVQTLIEQTPQLKDQPDIRKLSPLHHAITAGNLDIVTCLIGNKADVNYSGPLGRTPLIWALFVREINLSIISALINAGANIEVKDVFGYPPLVYAAKSGNLELINLLLSKNITIPIEPPCGQMLLDACAQNGLIDLLNKLIEKGIDVHVNGLLHSAASNGQNEIIEILLSKNNNIDQRSNGWTPLHYASCHGRLSTIEFLLDRGADINALTEGMGQSCANLADENEKTDAVNLLERKGLRLSPPDFPHLRGEYLGQKKPGRVAELFAPGIVNIPTTLHSCIIFSPDGKEAFWSFAYSNDRTMVSRLENGVWTYPQRAVFGDIPVEDMPVFHPDGHSFYDLARFRQYPDGKKREKEDIWIWDRKGNELSDPRPLPQEINSLRLHWQFSVDRNGNVYLNAALPGSEGGSDIYVCRNENGNYKKPENIGKEINSADDESFPYVEPDGEYILFARKFDIYISFRNKTGQWTEARPVGPEINTQGLELFATVTSDGKYLFFIRNTKLYWIDAVVLEKLRPERAER